MLCGGHKKLLHPSAFENKLDKKPTPIKFRDYQHLLLLCNNRKIVMVVIIQIYFQDLGSLPPKISSNMIWQLKFKAFKLYLSFLQQWGKKNEIPRKPKKLILFQSLKITIHLSGPKGLKIVTICIWCEGITSLSSKSSRHLVLLI